MQGNTPMKEKNTTPQLNIIIALLVIIIILLAGTVMQLSALNTSITTSPSAAVAKTPTTTTPTPAKPAAQAVSNVSLLGHSLGSMSAPKVMVIFSDFECPFCVRFEKETFPQIKKNYIDTGKLRVVFKHYPLSFHKNAQKAGEAAECAAEQNKFWEMHNKLFTQGVVGGVDTYKKYASDLSLDTEKFNTCLDSGKTAAKVKSDAAEGSAIGVTGTPSFVINNKKYVGAQPYSAFQLALDGTN